MPLRALLLLLLTGLLVGCRAGRSEQESAPPLSCDALSLAASSAQPLDSVAVRGLPDAYDGLLYAEVHVPADTATGYAFTGRTAGGGVRLQVPLHPSGSIEGGTVKLQFTDGATRCPALRFDVEPLPPAPGTFHRVVDQVQDFVRAPAAPSDVSEMTAERLDWAMSLAMSSDIATSGRAKDIFSAFKAALALGAGLSSAAGAGPWAAGFTDAALIAFAYEQAALAAANLLPRRFTDLDFTLHKPGFMEDDAEPGHWSGARVTAVSKGWQLDQMILQTLLFASGLKGSGGITKKTGWIEAMPRGHMRKLAYNLRQFLISDLIGKLIGGTAGKGGPLKIGPQTFRADISDPQWHDAKYGGRAVQVILGSEGKAYEPISAGRSTITVSTPPKKFGFQLIRREKTIDVRPIRVTVRPVKVLVSPGDTVTFHAEVENAQDSSLAWRIDPSEGHVLRAARSNAHVVDVLVSPDAAALPAVLQARSTADRSHLRSAPKRAGAATLQGTELRLTPARACVRPGETQAFRVEAPEVDLGGVVLPAGGSNPGDYRWRASSGSISAEGVFTAPEASGTVTITATSPEDPDLRGEVEIRYGKQCNSRFSYTTAGDLTLQREDQFYGLSGLPNSSGRCLLELWFEPMSPAANALEHTIHFRAVLPDGLREGSHPIGRNYTGTVGPNDVLLSESMKLATAAPGTFFGSFSAKKKHGTDQYPEQFLSENGTLTVRTFDGKQLEATFSLQMIESDPEAILTELGAQRGTKPRRSITVEGRLIHTVRSGTIGTGGVIDNYRCALPESPSSPASK